MGTRLYTLLYTTVIIPKHISILTKSSQNLKGLNRGTVKAKEMHHDHPHLGDDKAQAGPQSNSAARYIVKS